jgi:malto-oligosyltrehalose trehalohydrolase
MPFGAESTDTGATRFRLWAPSARTVEVELSTSRTRRAVAMQCSGGWHEAIVKRAPAGTRYTFRIDGGLSAPDPASRCNPDDIHASSAVVDPCDFDWPDGAWRGRPWEEAVLYELHVGTFTPEGTFLALIDRLDYLVDLGVSAIELMPVADFPGTRNWGYDGVLAFAPDAAYGTPNDLKRLIAAAHMRGLMVILDVVYNHFGPEGNYLHAYAQEFFNREHQTPWGAAINFDGIDAQEVRRFYIENALYWLEEYSLDGLRLDAVHAIVDESDPDIVMAIACAIRAGPGRERHIHLILENDSNQSRYLARDPQGHPVAASAQWNDDVHHVLHILLTGETDGYYADYAERPLWYLGRVLAEGFAYQGEPSAYRGGVPRGETSTALPPAAFVAFLQTHDQVGNRAFGERISALASEHALRAATACVLLAPAPPMLFMGEEFAASAPFLFFCEFGPELAEAVTRGRRAEFARFAEFADPATQARIPDPNDIATFNASKLDWRELDDPRHRSCLDFYRTLLALRSRIIAPRLAGMQHGGSFRVAGDRALFVRWTLGDASELHLLANLSAEICLEVTPPPGEQIFAVSSNAGAALVNGELQPWSVTWFLKAQRG